MPRSSRPCCTRASPARANLKIIYSPLHGVGASAVCPVLDEAGFRDVEIFGPHAEPNGDFPNVPKHVANPENAAVFDAMIERAKQTGADLILATDPDCDRLGCAVPKSLAPDAAWVTLTGNQLGSLLTDFLLGDPPKRPARSPPSHYVVKTLVTTELMRRIADHYGVQTAGNLHVGFKWIGGEMDARGPERFVFGAEESYGFLAGDHVRDKDAAVASLLTAELAAQAEGRGQDALPEARRAVPPLRLPHRRADQRANARRKGHGRHAGPDGQVPHVAAGKPRRPEGRPGARLSQPSDHCTPDGNSQPLDGPNGRHGDSRPGTAATTWPSVPRARSRR